MARGRGPPTISFLIERRPTRQRRRPNQARESAPPTSITATVNAELKVGAIEETVTVSGSSPVVDLQNVKTQVVMTREIVDTIPTGRYFQSLAVLIPGVTASGGYSATANQDVGGQSGQAHSALAIHGGRASDMQMQLDGMNTSSWNRNDTSIVLFTDGNIGEYAIEVAGKSAEAETGGVRINMIPREGGNRFRGGFTTTFSNPSLQSDNVSDDLEAAGLPVANTLKRMWSVNPDVGRPALEGPSLVLLHLHPQRLGQLRRRPVLQREPGGLDLHTRHQSTGVSRFLRA